jgi:GTP-binding protein
LAAIIDFVPSLRRAALPRIVLVGRPNVGKSTLFNRITAARRSIVTAVPGTTRDVIVHPAEWRGRRFDLVDTGGLFGASADPLHHLVKERGEQALATADVLVMVADGREGKVPADEEIAAAARATGTPVILAINKTDDRRAQSGALELYQLGFDPVVEVAAEQGLGVGDLLDEIVRRLPPDRATPARAPEEQEPDQETGVAIVGRPNVGKSSLVNRLLREERVLVSEMPGTTRDAVDTVLLWHRRSFRIVDTAGIRRPGRVARSGQVEAVSVVLSQKAMERADVAVVVIDAVEGATDQDAAIAGAADKAGRGIIVAVNKWDLMKDQGPEYAKTFDAELARQMKFLDYAPVLHVSARTGERTPKLLELIDRVAAARRFRVATSELNKFVETVTGRHPPASPGRKEVRILYATQVGVAPPAFVFFTNVATRFHFSYQRFLSNQLRERFGFVGTPIRMQVRTRTKKPRG